MRDINTRSMPFLTCVCLLYNDNENNIGPTVVIWRPGKNISSAGTSRIHAQIITLRFEDERSTSLNSHQPGREYIKYMLSTACPPAWRLRTSRSCQDMPEPRFPGLLSPTPAKNIKGHSKNVRKKHQSTVRLTHRQQTRFPL